MSDEDKAREIASKWWQDLITKEHCDSTEEAIERAVLEMAQWKEQQMIDKAVEWLNTHLPFGEVDFNLRNTIIEFFKQSMTEE